MKNFSHIIKKKKKNFEKFSWKTINPTFFRLYQAQYEEYLMYGGFPEVVLAKRSKDKIDYLKDILNSHIELDIKNQYIIGRNLAPNDFNNYIWGGNLSK